jgi:predicted nucleotidyltransferase
MIVRNKEEIFRVLEEHREKLVQLGVRRLGLFGSSVREEATSVSDLDFVVDLRQKTFDAYMDVKEFLEDLFHCPVDLVMVDGIKPRIRETILKETIYAPGL